MADSIASTSALPLAEASPLLSTSEKVLLAQAVVELGNLDWSAVSALLSTSEALVPEVGERFTAEVRAVRAVRRRRHADLLLRRLVLLWCLHCTVRGRGLRSVRTIAVQSQHH